MIGPGPAVLDARGVTVRFAVRRTLRETLAHRPRGQIRAVDGVSLRLRAGEMLALVGESGSGKSTAALALARMVALDAGSIELLGRDITRVRGRALRALRRDIQMVFQDPYESLDPRWRVRDIVSEPLTVHRLAASALERRRRVDEALERVGLVPGASFAERFPHELSGGQRQRVALAACLTLEPKVLIADEPVSMLDVSVRAEVLSILSGLRSRGMAVLMITHDLATAVEHADRIAVMYLGRIVEQGAARAVVDHPAHPYTAALVSVVPDPDPAWRGQRTVLRGEVPDGLSIPPGCRFHPRCPAAHEPCPRVDPQLEPTGDAPGHEAACVLVSERAAAPGDRDLGRVASGADRRR